MDSISSRCDVIEKAIQRYHQRIFSLDPTTATKRSTSNEDEDLPFINDINFGGSLNEVQVLMNNPSGCHKYPEKDMDEHYEIKINSPDDPGLAKIIAFTNWGILRGLESFSQLITTESDENDNTVFKVKTTSLMDFPRFTYRGIMLDSARHYLPKSLILDNLDLMEMNKFNVLHWHITDSTSFPYQSSTFPDLSAKGAYSPKHIYTQRDVAEIVEAARIRGIRVVPEFDTPGHADSWEAGQPGLLTKCNTANDANYVSGSRQKQEWNYGPINPIKESVYTFLASFFKEIASIFPDKLMHLGGDEVGTKCWETNEEILEYMKVHNITGKFRLLESLYMNKLIGIITDLSQGKQTAVWQEVFSDHDKIRNDTVVHVWRNDFKGYWQQLIKNVTSKGYEVILSSPWYLNYISYGADWPKYYKIDPQDFHGTEEQQRLVKGGTACIWGEFVNRFNLIPRLWPRASAVAERLWSSRKTVDIKDAEVRLQEHECRMAKRGYPVEPINGPGFCDL